MFNWYINLYQLTIKSITNNKCYVFLTFSDNIFFLILYNFKREV